MAAVPRRPATDMMECRSCGQQDRASEGYPCIKCGTFICLICMLRGVTLCRKCLAASEAAPSAK